MSLGLFVPVSVSVSVQATSLSLSLRSLVSTAIYSSDFESAGDFESARRLIYPNCPGSPSSRFYVRHPPEVVTPKKVLCSAPIALREARRPNIAKRKRLAC